MRNLYIKKMRSSLKQEYFLYRYEDKGKEIENYIRISITEFQTPQNEKFFSKEEVVWKRE